MSIPSDSPPFPCPAPSSYLPNFLLCVQIYQTSQADITVCNKMRENESSCWWWGHIPGMEPPGFWALLQGLFKYFSQSRITAMGEAEGISLQWWLLKARVLS